jgi:glucuronosyltransferase
MRYVAKISLTIWYLLVGLLVIPELSAYNLLFLSPITTPSHSNFFKPVVKAMVDRGHFVTYYSGLNHNNQQMATNNQTINFRPLSSSPALYKISTDHQVDFNIRDKPLLFLSQLPQKMENYCTAIYNDPVFQQLINTAEKFDIIVIEGYLNDCVLPLVAMFDVPFIYMSGVAPVPWLLNAFGSPLATDHVPNAVHSFTDEMNFWQRTVNTVSSISGVYLRHWLIMPVVDRMAHNMLGKNLPAIEEIERHYMSLLIVNTHSSINYQLPLSPAIIQAGGLHCVPPKPLPKDLESFVDGSGDAGFIIVSFGSVLKGVDMPNNFRRIFLSTFARLPQRILWKWEDQPGENDSIPSNVKLLPWMPQQDLLGHPKIRLFITHGGLFSNQEAVYHGVPFIVMPIFADQPINAQKAHDDGYAIRVDMDSMSEEILFDAIQRILTDPK